MDASSRRRVEDVRRLRELVRTSAGRIAIEDITGEPASRLTLRLGYRTAPGRGYPAQTTDVVRISISLPPRYPFVAPRITVLTPIFHPNIYSSGLVCLGDTWLASESLDALVRRVIRLVTFDPLISGGEPPANSDAARWYRRLLANDPRAFPTDTVSFEREVRKTRIGFSDLGTLPDRTTVQCPSCAQKMRLPAGKSGAVKCPGCGERFEVST